MTEIAVGLPVYNAMPFLEESLDSLLQQSDGQFVILAVDDGSTDSGLKYLQSVRDPRLRIFTQPNRGLTSTLNRILREANARWLMRHDADDVASPDRVAITRRWIEKFPDAGMFYSDARYYQNGRGTAAFRTTRAEPEQLRGITQGGHLLAVCHPTVTLNIQKTLAAGGYRFNLHVEDIDLWWRMALNYDLRYIPEVTTYFRHNAGSICATNLERQSVATLYVQYLLLSHLRGLPSLSFERVRPELARMVDRKKLQFREHMRSANMCLSRRKYLQAAKHLVAAGLSSPSVFLNRVLYEVRNSTIALQGEDPSKFLQQADVLWPKRVSTAALDPIGAAISQATGA
jgi:hypothetical protein